MDVELIADAPSVTCRNCLFEDEGAEFVSDEDVNYEGIAQCPECGSEDLLVAV